MVVAASFPYGHLMRVTGRPNYSCASSIVQYLHVWDGRNRTITRMIVYKSLSKGQSYGDNTQVLPQ
jgi:hypothetical protein